MFGSFANPCPFAIAAKGPKNLANINACPLMPLPRPLILALQARRDSNAGQLF